MTDPKNREILDEFLTELEPLGVIDATSQLRLIAFTEWLDKNKYQMFKSQEGYSLYQDPTSGKVMPYTPVR